MLQKLQGYKTIIAMSLAVVVALWQYFVGPLPAIDPKLWDIAVPVVALGLRFMTKSAVFQPHP